VHANLTGVDLPARPFLALGSGPAVYLIDEAPPLWAQITRLDAPATIPAGATATLTVALHNRGSIAWNPDAVWLVPVAPRDHDSALCDAASWRSCRQAATVGAAVAPGGDVTLTVTLRAPATAGTIRECFALRDGAVYFSDPGEMGFADDALCRSVTVTAPVSPADAGVPARDAGTPDAGAPEAGRDAGASDAGVVAVDDAGDPGVDGSVDEAPGADALTGSCGCRAPGSRPVAPRGLALLGMALLARRRRRR
jgi:MYXO-CTERM domain-containing protein